MQFQYALLRYYRSFFDEENVNIGIALYDYEAQKLFFKPIVDRKAMEDFDPDLDIEILNMLMIGLENHFAGYEKASSMELKSIIKFYINELKFTPPEIVIEDSFESVLERIEQEFFCNCRQSIEKRE